MREELGNGVFPVFNRKVLYGIIVVLGLSQVTACGHVSSILKSGKRDSAPNVKIDVSRIPDAVPKNEPRSQYGNPSSYVVFGKHYHVMKSSKGFIERGVASWYGTKFHGKRTSSGETYDMFAMTAAHKRLPLPTYVRVTNLQNGRHVIVRVNDRGPFHENRIIDLSYTAALKLDIVKRGTALVEVRALEAGQPTSVKSDFGVETSTAAGVDSFYIQIGAFSWRANAEKLKRKLELPFGQRIIKISPVTIMGDTLYRVKIGPLSDIALADSIIAKLIDHGVVEHQIVIN